MQKSDIWSRSLAQLDPYGPQPKDKIPIFYIPIHGSARQILIFSKEERFPRNASFCLFSLGS